MARNPPAPPLAAGQIHVWWIDLAVCPADDSCLSAAEQSRARRFKFAHHRERYVAAHGALRAILAGYAGVPARDVRLVTAPGGKPAMDPAAHGARPPVFNLSHSAAHAALAIAGAGDIGIDIETPQAVSRRDTLMDLLAPSERAVAAGLDDEAFAAAFVVAWTRKEACLKAIGSGLALRPQQIEVGVETTARAVHFAVPAADTGRAHGAHTVHVVSMQSPAGIATALARVGEPIGAVGCYAYAGPDAMGAAQGFACGTAG